MTTALRQPRSAERGFSLIELLVVLIVIAIVVGIALPTLNALQRYGRGEAGVSTVSAAINAARILNHRLKQADFHHGGFPPYVEQARFRGTAVLFTPGGEIRILRHDQAAQWEAGAAPTTIDQRDNFLLYDPDDNWLGFTDVPGLDPVTLQSRVGVVGVLGPAGDNDLVTPPFAIRFNEQGNVASFPEVIYYTDRPQETNGSRLYGNRDRSGVDTTGFDFPYTAYDPFMWREWDPRQSSVPLDPESDQYEMPFDQIDTVAALLLYNANDAPQPVDGDDADDFYNWLFEEDTDGGLANATAVYLSPLSGFVLR